MASGKSSNLRLTQLYQLKSGAKCLDCFIAPNEIIRKHLLYIITVYKKQVKMELQSEG